MSSLKEINSILGLENSQNIIFVYCPPKVGSTTLVSTLRFWGSKIYKVVHVHDEMVIKVLCKRKDVSILDMIQYNKSVGKKVWVIDIFRSPIEMKMSVFFENLCHVHFNAKEEDVRNKPMIVLKQRFDFIFEHIGNEDYYRDIYPLHDEDDIPWGGDKGYIQIEKDGVQYIKLRLQDAEKWGSILSPLLKIEIQTIKDNETVHSSGLGDLYNRFKSEYKIPLNLLERIESHTLLLRYMTVKERQQYINEWKGKTKENVEISSVCDYQLYQKITWENQNYFDILRKNHYKDDGCGCTLCENKRQQLRIAILKKQYIPVNVAVNHGKEVQLENQRRIKIKKKISNFLKKKEKLNTPKIQSKMIML